jgi:putative PIN family toxin of toxin-antitoxin system
VLRVVLDTNVLVAALRSRRGAANAIVQALYARRFIAVVSNTLCFEHHDVLARPDIAPDLSVSEAEAWLDAFLRYVEFHEVDFLWRPHLPDPDDERVLDAAIAGNAQYIVTRNISDFWGCEALGIKAVTPDIFMHILRQS